MDTLPPTAQHKLKTRSDRYSREELDRIITQLDTDNRVMYLREIVELSILSNFEIVKENMYFNYFEVNIKTKKIKAQKYPCDL